MASADGGSPAPRKVRLSSPVTHSDWMLGDPAPPFGAEGVQQILDRAKACGWTRVYWRCFDSGKSMYHSRLLEPFGAAESPNYWDDHGMSNLWAKLAQCDYGRFDTFAEAMRYGHAIGLEVHAWLSINEDDHGYGWPSRVAREHPEWHWVQRDGRVYRSQLSFAFPEVRMYKLALLREILAYRPDGIFFDWIRTGDVRDNPQTDASGVAAYGYEDPNVERFRKLCGTDPHDVPNDDPRWVALRAEPQTKFMREAARLIRRMAPDLPISAMVQHPWSYRGAPTDTPYDGSLRGLLCDVRTWAREGLIDEAVAAGYYREGGTPAGAFEWLRKETEGRIGLWLYGWLGAAYPFRADTKLAESLGASELLLWESNYIGLPPANQAAVEAMAEYARGGA